MLAALNDFFPPELKWTHPLGGLFLWVTLPAGVDCMRMFDEAIKHNVAFVPGRPFFAEGEAGPHMRLNFSHATPEMIREGIRRLSIAVAHEIEHGAATEAAVTASEAEVLGSL